MSIAFAIKTVADGGGYPFGDSRFYLVCEPDSRNALPYVKSDNNICISILHICKNPKLYDVWLHRSVCDKTF